MVNPSLENSKKTSIQQVDYQSWLIVVFREEWEIQKRNQQQHLSQSGTTVHLLRWRFLGSYPTLGGLLCERCEPWQLGIQGLPVSPCWCFRMLFGYFLETCHKSRQISLGYPDYPKGHVDLCVQTPIFFQQIRGSQDFPNKPCHLGRICLFLGGRKIESPRVRYEENLLCKNDLLFYVLVCTSILLYLKILVFEFCRGVVERQLKMIPE